MTAYRPVIYIILALAFASWVVALAGISTITSDCYSNYNGYGYYGSSKIFSHLNLASVNLGQNCVRGLQFQWWGVWFEFIVLVFVSAYASSQTFSTHAATIAGLLATVTAINMINSRLFLDPNPQAYNYVYFVANRQSGLNTAAAGYIMFCTFNLILVLLIGSGLVWFGEADLLAGGGGGKGAAAGVARGPGPNFSQPTTFASPLSGGGARAYLPNSGAGGEGAVSQ